MRSGLWELVPGIRWQKVGQRTEKVRSLIWLILFYKLPIANMKYKHWLSMAYESDWTELSSSVSQLLPPPSNFVLKCTTEPFTPTPPTSRPLCRGTSIQNVLWPLMGLCSTSGSRCWTSQWERHVTYWSSGRSSPEKMTLPPRTSSSSTLHCWMPPSAWWHP